MFRILPIIFFLLNTTLPVLAAHLKGGYIEYKNLGPTPGNPNSTRFNINVYQYLDCNSAGGQIDYDINVGIYNLATNIMESVLIIPLTRTVITQKKEFNCIDIPPNICYRIDNFETTTDLPNNSNGFLVTVQRCCRIAGINNISNSVNSGVTYSIKIFPSGTGVGFLNNSSPVFAREDTALVCGTDGFTLPFKATDPDGDSLVYSFTAGLNTPTREAKPLPPNPPPFPALDYANVFSAAQPMGATVTIDSKTGIINGVAPSTPGDYVVAVLVEEYRNGIKIAETRKEIHISVANCTSPKAVLPPEIINCKTFDVQFTNLSSSPGIRSYSWDFGVAGAVNDTSNASSPRFTFPDTGVYRVKLAINRFELCNDSTYTNVRIFPGFTPAFSATGVCSILPYQFTDQTTTAYGSINSWRWDFGDNSSLADTSSTRNPKYDYPVAGSYKVLLKVSSSKGCVDTISKIVLVSDKPVVQLAFRDTLICSIDTLQLRASGQGSFSWTPANDIINPNSATPLVHPKKTTTYHIVINNGGCIGEDSVRVNVVDFVSLYAGNDTTICLTDAVQLQPVSNGLSFNWNPAATLNNAAIKNPVATPLAPQTNYTITAVIGRCSATDAVMINTLPYPQIDAGIDTTICFGEAAFLHGTSNADFVRWTPVGIIQNNTALEAKAFPVDTRYFILTANNATGCTKPISDSVLVTVLPKILVDAGPDSSLVLDQPLQMMGATNASNYSWSPAFGLSNANILNPVLLISTDAASTVSDPLVYTLTAVNAKGCSVSDKVLIRVFKTGPSIFVPGGFTPNSDGLNDVIRPILAGMKELNYFRIYNRFGQLVFETKTIGKGWDGRLKGQLQATAAFVYTCQAVDYLGNIQRAKGSFVLIR